MAVERISNEIDMRDEKYKDAEEVTAEFDEDSGRTLDQNGPWVTILNDCRNVEKEKQRADAAGSMGQAANNQRSRGGAGDEYKVVFRPRAGMKVASWTDRAISQGLAMASEVPTKEFYAHVTIQTQWAQNLIVASTASEDFALKLHEVTKVQLGTVTYYLLPYLKPIPRTVRGVVHGIEAETSERELMELVSAKGHNIMHARMLGKSNSALLTFQGPHVPYYVQYCRACGEVGHRQDVCPHPATNQCPRCGEKVNPEGHDCQPRCKICDQPHETASKECKIRLKPGPPPLHVREKNDSGNQQVKGTAYVAGSINAGKWSRQPASMDDFPQLESRRGDKCDKNCEKMIEELKRQNGELLRRLEENERRAQAREQELERKLQQLIDQMPGQSETIFAESDGSESASPPLKRRTRVTARGRREARKTKPVNGDEESFVTKSMLESAITGCTERMLTMLQSRCSRLAQGTSNPFEAWPHYTREEGNLQQYVSTKEEESTPDVIAVQETWGMAKLSSYRAYGKDAKEKTRVKTLDRRNLPVIEHDTGISTVEHGLVEIISNTKRDGRSVFVLNVYSSPAKRHKFAALFRATLEIAKQQALVVVGDFNPPHPDWGYLTETVKGRNLWHDAHDGGLTMITDPDQPTRRGDARHRDTTPDLAFVRNVKGAEWINTWEDLGSDHFVAAATVIAGPGKPKGRRIRITEWDAFRGF
ncbi:hypothetical protein HPB47_023953 [Ixodes persulcatus]|uniref:Uncharacterized protein n=1 Tax=Ixodes persulcatus TaxID=34615 RepID=A0AC60Q8L2_IXOPE|nr:hypothetical protein HPB47_023953 [Ixodes persulcatus]